VETGEDLEEEGEESESSQLSRVRTNELTRYAIFELSVILAYVILELSSVILGEGGVSEELSKDDG
jgi:hypothetical protein